MDWNTAATWIPIVFAAVGLASGYMAWRKSELRREEVFSWASECIESMQTLFLITLIRKDDKWRFHDSSKISEIIFRTSILIERGRLLFRNEKNDHGAEKEIAYRGLRPRILDQLVIAHQIALCWEDVDAEKRLKLCMLAEQCVKRFVSFAQQEVGRDRAACVAAQQGGEGVILSDLLSDQVTTPTKYKELETHYLPR